MHLAEAATRPALPTSPHGKALTTRQPCSERSRARSGCTGRRCGGSPPGSWQRCPAYEGLGVRLCHRSHEGVCTGWPAEGNLPRSTSTRGVARQCGRTRMQSLPRCRPAQAAAVLSWHSPPHRRRWSRGRSQGRSGCTCPGCCSHSHRSSRRRSCEGIGRGGRGRGGEGVRVGGWGEQARGRRAVAHTKYRTQFCSPYAGLDGGVVEEGVGRLGGDVAVLHLGADGGDAGLQEGGGWGASASAAGGGFRDRAWGRRGDRAPSAQHGGDPQCTGKPGRGHVATGARRRAIACVPHGQWLTTQAQELQSTGALQLWRQKQLRAAHRVVALGFQWAGCGAAAHAAAKHRARIRSFMVQVGCV